MSQIKIFGLRSSLSPIMREISDVIHSCAVDALHYPVDKRAHRFFPLETGEFFNPPRAKPNATRSSKSRVATAQAI